MINKIRDIKLIGFDVDGVFTDGKIYISEEGKESKVFHTQDGQGIRQLIDHGIKILVISKRSESQVYIFFGNWFIIVNPNIVN